MSFDYIAIGRRIREERLKQRWSQTDLSERTGISVSHISCIERGISEFSAGYLACLSDVFSLSADYLLKGNSSDKSSSECILLQSVQDCDPVELQVIINSVLSLKSELRKFYRNCG